MAIRTKVLVPALFLAAAPALFAPVFAEDKPVSAKVKDAFPDESRAVLEKPDELEVLSLICERPPKTGEDVFRGYPVRKRVKVKDADRAALLAALYQGIEDGGPVARCFEPHHGVHAKQGDRTVDLVICFVCLQTQVHDGGRRRTIATTKAPENALAKLLGEAVKPEVKVETKLYEGKSVKDWADLVAASNVRRRGGELPDELAPAVLALARAVKEDADPVTRTRAAATLARLGDKGAPAAPLLAEALDAATDRRDRFNALNVLAGLGPAAEPAVPALVKLLEASTETRDGMSLRALDVLRSIGPKAKAATPAILKWSENGETNIVQGALALARIGAGDEETTAALLARVEGARWNVKRALLQALGDLRAENARPALEKAAEDEDPRVRLTAKVALAQLAGDASTALPLVEKALEKDQEQVLRRFAAGDLRRAGGAKAVPLLAKLVAEDADDWVRHVAAGELGELGPAARDALPALEKALAATVSRGPLRERLEDAIDQIRE